MKHIIFLQKLGKALKTLVLWHTELLQPRLVYHKPRAFMNCALCCLTTVLFVLSSPLFAQQKENTTDTVIINFGQNGSQMIFYLKDKEDVQQLEEIDFKKLMGQVAVYVDSAYFSENGYVEVNDDLGKYKVKMPWSDRNWSSDAEEPELKLVRKDDRFISVQSEKDDLRRTHRYLNFEFGLGGYFQDGKIPQDTDLETRPWGSRYVAINLMSRTRLSRQTRKAFYLKYGISFSWSNFMFDRNVQLVENDNTLEFIDPGFGLEKSKLTVSYINAPMMFQFYMKNKIKISAGGYAGYRLGSYTKIKYNNDGDTEKDHDRGNYQLSPFRYGLRAELGWSWFTLFANYDLNPLFRENSNVPELHAFNFGIRL